MITASLLLFSEARAATDPCKVNAKSTACKAQQEKLAAAKKTKTTPATAKTAEATAPRTAAKPATKAVAPVKEPTTKAAATRKKPVAAKDAAVKKEAATRKDAAGKKEAIAKRESVAKEKTATRETTKRKVVVARAPAVTVRRTPVAGPTRQDRENAIKAVARLTPSQQAAALRSSVAYVQDLQTSTVLFAKNEDEVRPIASISKLMTALLIVDANQPMDEVLEVTDDDVDRLRHAASRLPVGSKLTRADMLHVALMSSENRAAHALARYYPGGMTAFVEAMNDKAKELGMADSHFVEPTGLSSDNVSSPRDLVRLLRAVSQRPLIHRYTTDTEYDVEMRKGRMQTFVNTNALVRNPDWDIKISKTGFINEAGECLVMLTRIGGRELAIVLLDAQGKYSRVGDAIRIRKFVQSDVAML